MKDEKSKTETQGSPDTKVKTFSEKKEENATPEKESESREKKDVHGERGFGKAHKTPRSGSSVRSFVRSWKRSNVHGRIYVIK